MSLAVGGYIEGSLQSDNAPVHRLHLLRLRRVVVSLVSANLLVRPYVICAKASLPPSHSREEGANLLLPRVVPHLEPQTAAR